MHFRHLTLTLFLAIAALAGCARHAVDAAQPGRARAMAAYRRLPLAFEASGKAAFIARGDRYDALVEAGGTRLRLLDSDLRMRLIGADPRATATVSEPLPGKANYFLGSDSRQWRTDVSRYARVRYAEVYPGIDVVYYGSGRLLEHDFIVAPGARPESIVFRFDGAESVRLNGDGDLLLKTATDDLLLHKPVVYQQNENGRHAVDGHYAIAADRRATFEIGDYDRDRELVIDPVLGYSTFVGGSGQELGNAIAVDAAGNAYVTGFTASTNFPTNAGAFRTTRAGSFGQDAFVTKLDSKGAVVYSTYLGGDLTDTGNGIAVDSAGNAYIAGQTNSTNFPVTAGALKTTNTGNIAFITKLNSAGNALVYSTFLGGNSTDRVRAIAVDSSGSAYVAGFTTSADFPVLPGAIQSTRKSNDAFVAKLNPAGSFLVYSTFLGGSGFQDDAYGIAVDPDGNAYVTGKTDSTDFPVTTGAFITKAPGGNDAFVAKVSASGTSLVYATYLGGKGEDRGNAIAADAAGNAYVTGYTYATDFPTMAAVQPECGCKSSVGGGVQSDAFVTKLAPNGAGILYSTFYGGIGPDSGTGIGVTRSGDIYFAGTTDGISPSTFPLVDSMKATKGLLDDAFAVHLNAGGSAAIYSTFFGGDVTDFAAGMAVDSAGNVYLTGNTDSPDMPTTAGAGQRTYGGGNDDVFVTRIGNAVIPVPASHRRAVRH